MSNNSKMHAKKKVTGFTNNSNDPEMITAMEHGEPIDTKSIAVKTNKYYELVVFMKPVELKLFNLMISKVNSQIGGEGEFHVLYNSDIRDISGIYTANIESVMDGIFDALIKSSDGEDDVTRIAPLSAYRIYDKTDQRLDGNRRICFKFGSEFEKYILNVNGADGGYTALHVNHDGYKNLRSGAVQLYDFCRRWRGLGKYQSEVSKIWPNLGFRKEPLKIRDFNIQMKRVVKQINDKTEFSLSYTVTERFNKPHKVCLTIEEDKKMAPIEAKSTGYLPAPTTSDDNGKEAAIYAKNEQIEEDARNRRSDDRDKLEETKKRLKKMIKK